MIFLTKPSASPHPHHSLATSPPQRDIPIINLKYSHHHNAKTRLYDTTTHIQNPRIPTIYLPTNNPHPPHRAEHPSPPSRSGLERAAPRLHDSSLYSSLYAHIHTMALPLPVGLTPAETAFLCENEPITVIPRQRMQSIELLSVCPPSPPLPPQAPVYKVG
jgi:hypothetical protein